MRCTIKNTSDIINTDRNSFNIFVLVLLIRETTSVLEIVMHTSKNVSIAGLVF